MRIRIFIAIAKERLQEETRVAATPATTEQLRKLGFTVLVESGAGASAGFSDEAYTQAAASIANDAKLWTSELIYKVNAPTEQEISKLSKGSTLVSFIWPAQNPDLVARLAAVGVRLFSR